MKFLLISLLACSALCAAPTGAKRYDFKARASEIDRRAKLISDADVKGDRGRAHNAVIPGRPAVKADGKYIHESVWRYLFTHPVDAIGTAVPGDADCWIDQRNKRP